MDVTYRFDGFSVDPVRRLLFGPDGKPVALKPRVFDTLLYLIEHRGELLGKQALLDGIWPHVVVEENNLNQAISTLRRVLGETRGEHRFIVTEPGRGYRFVARVETGTAEPRGSHGASPESPLSARAGSATAVPEEAAPNDGGAHASSEQVKLPTRNGALRPGSWLGLSSAAVLLAAAVLFAVGTYRSEDGAQTDPRSPSIQPAEASPSVAVLPFADLSEGGDRMWLADGLAEEILNSLARVPELKVTGRTSSFQFRNQQSDIGRIASRLGVAHVLEGSVRVVDDQLRVTAQLVRASDSFHVWSDTYDGTTSDLLDFQRDVAERVAAALHVVLDDDRRALMFATGTRNVEAFEAYRQGVAVLGDALSSTSTRPAWDALPYFDRALNLDPRYALAAQGKASLFSLALLQGSPGYSQEEALALLLENLDLVASHSPTPGTRLVAEIFRESLSPTWHRMPVLLGRLRGEVDSVTFGEGLDGAAGMGRLLMVTGSYDLARRLAERLVSNDPLAIQGWLRKVNVEIHSGNFETARNVLAEARRTIGADPRFSQTEFNMARLEGRRDLVIAYLSDAPGAGNAMFLAAVQGQYAAALRMADEHEERLKGPATGMLFLLVDTYHEIGAADRLKNVVKRIDDSPAGALIFMQILGVSGGLAFDLHDAPNFAAKLEQADVDPASFMQRLPRLSVVE